MTCHGDEVTTTTAQLSSLFNKRVEAAHSHFTDLQLTDEGNNTVKVSGEKDGKPMSISGPLQVNSNGELQLHANKITQNGTNEKGLMGLFGKDLADEVSLKHSPSLSAHGNDLDINVDKLLNLSGRITSMKVQGSKIEMQFASQPCR